MHRDLGDRADFHVVYIAEAHSADGWQMASNVAEGVVIDQPRAFAERVAAATRCAAELGLSIPTLVDGMDDAALEAFAAWPERIFIADAGGRLAYCGGPGPFEFDPAGARAVLEQLVASRA